VTGVRRKLSVSRLRRRRKLNVVHHSAPRAKTVRAKGSGVENPFLDEDVDSEVLQIPRYYFLGFSGFTGATPS
jgi:hypothetical protein